MKELQILDDVKMVWEGYSHQYVRLVLSGCEEATIYLTPKEIINMARVVEQWLGEKEAN